MGKDSAISWTDHTFNPWWGCVKVSPACTHCYAETFSNRVGQDVWGKDSQRRFFGDKHWKEPFTWNDAARAAGAPALVFCASMSDVFEDRRDLDAHRERLWKVIEGTESLIWLLLTKRPECIERMVPRDWLESWPRNVWPGTTTESGEWFDKRWPHLERLPAPTKWLSVEPMLGPLDLSAGRFGVKWVIVGGESGHHARDMEETWVRDIAAQCALMGIPFHFKQTGGVWAKRAGLAHHEGKDASEWPTWLRVQRFPEAARRALDGDKQGEGR